jgi:hypothetical protein
VIHAQIGSGTHTGLSLLETAQSKGKASRTIVTSFSKHSRNVQNNMLTQPVVAQAAAFFQAILA